MQQYIDRLRERYVDQPVKWAAIAGFALVVLGAFGPWATVGVAGFHVSANGFDYNGALVLILALAALGGIGAYTFARGGVPLATLLWALVACAAVIDVLVLINFLDIVGTRGVGVGWGLWLTVIGAVAASLGAVVPMWAEIQARGRDLRGGSHTS